MIRTFSLPFAQPLPRLRLSPWWIGMILLLFVGSLVHLVGYNHSLPYIDDSDESTFLTKSFTWRGLYNQPEVVPGYPPGVIMVEVATQLGIEAVSCPPPNQKPHPPP